MTLAQQPDPMTLAAQVQGRRLPPIHTWQPDLCGDMDMRIGRDGVWYYQGSPIERVALARLFSTVLRREADGCYYLVTPVEKWRISVDDAPFLAVLMTADVSSSGGQVVKFTTTLGDMVESGKSHPIRVNYREPGGEPSPYVHIRDRLWALLARSVFVELAELVEVRVVNGSKCYVVESHGCWFDLGPVE